jgi:hypothetical protein
VAARVVSGRRHESPVIYELVEEVVRAVGRDVIKVLILDRGFIDGAQMGRLQQDYRIETILPVRANMDLHADALGLTRLADFRWEPYVPAVPPEPPPAATPKPPGSKNAKPSASRPWPGAKPNSRPRRPAMRRRRRASRPRPCWASGAGC